MERLKEDDLGRHEREEIERQLEEIDATFNFLDEGDTLGEERTAPAERLLADLCLEMVSLTEGAVRREWFKAATGWIELAEQTEAGRRPN